MTAQQRRERICKILETAPGPVSASTLASELGVSRQIVVGDVALLRAAGYAIDATPRGYVRQGAGSGCSAMIACCHNGVEQLRQELYCVVDNGGMLENVIIENPLYGEIVGQLQIGSRYDADTFVNKAKEFPGSLFSSTTDGVHLHTVRCPDRESMERIRAGLQELGILYEK